MGRTQEDVRSARECIYITYPKKRRLPPKGGSPPISIEEAASYIYIYIYHACCGSKKCGATSKASNLRVAAKTGCIAKTHRAEYTRSYTSGYGEIAVK